MTWHQTYDQLTQEAQGIRDDARQRYGFRDCMANRRANKRADELDRQAWKLQEQHKFGPPRPNTERFEQWRTA